MAYDLGSCPNPHLFMYIGCCMAAKGDDASIIMVVVIVPTLCMVPLAHGASDTSSEVARTLLGRRWLFTITSY